MAAKPWTEDELREEINQKRELIEITHQLREQAAVVIRQFMGRPENSINEEQQQKLMTAHHEYSNAQKVIEEEVRVLNQMEEELKAMTSSKRISGYAESTSTNQSINSRIRKLEAKLKEDLVQLRHIYYRGKANIEDQLEDLNAKLTTLMSESMKAELVAEKARLEKRLSRAQRDYTTDVEMLKEEAEARKEVLLAEQEEEEEVGDADVASVQDAPPTVKQWVHQQQRYVPYFPQNVLRQPANTGDPGLSGNGSQRSQMQFQQRQSNARQPRQKRDIVSTQAPADKDTMLMTLMQQQLNFMQRSRGDKFLPEFDGDPAKWGIFRSAYERAQDKFGFDDAENLARLQRALKGRARDAVEHLLTNEGNMEEIWKTLNNRFGRSEFVIEHLVEKVRKCQRPDINKPESVLEFGTMVQALVTNIHSYDRPMYMFNIQLVNELVDKLPGTLKGSWYKYRVQNGVNDTDLQQFADWLDTEVQCAMLQVKPTVGTAPAAKSEEKNHSRPPRRNIGSVHASSGEEEDTARKCPACNVKGHGLHSCWKLKKKSLDERWNLVKAARVCFTCLKDKHTANDCPESRVCGKDGCTRTHHRLLHPERRFKKSEKASTDDKEGAKSEEDGSVGVAVSLIKGTDGPLPIVPVRVKGPDGVRVVYAMLDSGATRTLMSKDLASELNLKGPTMEYKFRTMAGEIVRCKDSKKVNLEISGRYKNAKMYPLTDVVTVDKIGVAPYSIDVEEAKLKWPHLRRYKGPSLSEAVVDIVVGSDHGFLAMHRDLLYTSPEKPVAMRTVLGWIMLGKLGKSSLPGSGFHVGGVSDDTLDKLIIESFRLNDYAVRDSEALTMSRQDERALEILQKTTRQLENGRWETSLLWKNQDPFPDNTYDEALSRLVKTERRMEKSPQFQEIYRKKIREYLDKKYIRKLQEQEAATTTERTWYIPHFGVINPNKPGKFRLVFDCAAESKGQCLNYFLLTGPDLIRPLPAILWNFCRHPVVICGDIEDMFHRIFIRKEDMPAQRFLWRDGDSKRDPDIYEMQVMLFGATSSPASAIFVKDKNAKRFIDDYPEAVNAILNDMYVDDNLTGSETVEGAIRLRKEITGINGRGGFIIKKWISNSLQVMQSIPESLRLAGNKALFQEGNTERVLGLYWDPNDDCFTFRINFSKVKPEVVAGRRPTKREMCSLLMSLFDPLGFVVHYKIKGMIMFQNTWKDGIGWDDAINDDVYSSWIPWLNQMTELEQLRIPRCYSLNLRRATIQLHTFVDASAEATCAISYLRVEWDDQVEVSFVASKAHVANIKKSTIPRQELCAALTGSKLAHTILKDLRIKVDTCVFWSDSATVLSWITSESARFKEYVANRVRKIQNLTNPCDWRWIGTAENVADEGTRSRGKADLSSGSRWIRGPAFLRQSSDNWPRKDSSEIGSCSLAVGEESSGAVPEGNGKRERFEIVPDAKRFSSFYKLVRATAAVPIAAKHWIKKIRNPSKKFPGPWQWKDGILDSPLSAECLLNAEKIIIRHVQLESQAAKIGAAQQKLKMVVDEDDILRMTGRVRSSDGSAPILLPPRHYVVDLIIDQEHRKNMHCGRNTVFNNLRQRYWISDGRHAVRRSWTRCLPCRLQKAKPIPPEMGLLPKFRVECEKPPFTYTGADLFGPVEVTVGRHHEKRWGLLFTCMVTRAVHLEIVYGLTADETLMGISRFVDARGLPSHMYTDNGTNFQAAAKEISKRMKYHGLCWHFIPPASPHMGGAWEAMVKQVKRVLHQIIKEKFPRDQVLLTALKAVENVVNSRPLAYVSSDLNDQEAITPNHFIRGVGVASGGLSNRGCVTGSADLNGDINEGKEKFGKQWEKAQVLAKQFWSRWSNEVLPDLQKRNKWNITSKPVAVGDVVIMVDDQRPRNEWIKALVTRVFPGSGGVVRVVEVTTRKFRTKTPTTYRRAVTKICPTGIRCCDLATVLGKRPNQGAGNVGNLDGQGQSETGEPLKEVHAADGRSTTELERETRANFPDLGKAE